MIIRARWDGEPPRIGDFLRSPGERARYAYAIWDVDVKSPGRLVLNVQRVDVSEVPAKATVHNWKWDARGRKHAGKVQQR